MAETNAWIAERGVTIEDVERDPTPTRGVEEVVVPPRRGRRTIELPVALAADRDEHDRIVELRVYFSSWPLYGRHANRPPVLQPDLELRRARRRRRVPARARGR